MNNRPLISVVMPAYNAEDYIEDAIQSILSQTFSNFEFLIINDCSIDHTEEIIKKYSDERIVYLRNDCNRGISYTTNKGIECSRGRYIALMDDDDISLPDRLLLQVSYMEENETIDVLGTGGAYINEDGEIISYRGEPRRNPDLFRVMLLFGSVDFLNGSAMIRKQFINENGLHYKEECFGMQDFMFYMEASKVGRISSIKDILYYHRDYAQNTTNTVFKKHENQRVETFFNIQKESFARSGFALQDEDYCILAEILTEKRQRNYTLKQTKELYLFFNRIINQANKMNLKYYDELKFWCKKLLIDIISRCDLFDNV